MIKEIAVGGRLVSVPQGYVQAEAEFTSNESLLFTLSKDPVLKAAHRREVLEKREEFYQLWLSGKIKLPESEPVKKSRLERFIEWFDV